MTETPPEPDPTEEPTPDPVTEVTGRPRRPLALNSFDDLTDCPAATMRQNDDRTVTLTFRCELDPQVADAVWQRLTSEDDDDLRGRALIRTLRDDVQALTDADPTTDTPERRLLVALAARSLSEPPPLPEPDPEPDPETPQPDPTEEPPTWQLPTP